MKNMRINPFMEIPPAYRMTSIVQSPSTADLFMSSLTAAPRSGSQKKYLVCCLICGSFSCLLGTMFLGIYFLIRSYTFNGYFETVPTYVPAALLMVTGLFIVSFARRKFRYSCLIYFSGVTSATSALICAAVTVTTKVLHMSRLQDLNLNCEYKITTRICTCYSDFEDGPDEARKLLFNAATDCRVAQGDLYSCLQAIFGLSIAGVLVAVFSCMLSYLLYSHERKKMYWEQLDMRCRLLHATHFAGGHIGQPAITLPASIITNNSQGNPTSCIGCCEQCHTTTQQTPTSNSISGYPYAPIEFPWNDYTSGNCGSSKFLAIAGNNNNLHNHHFQHNHPHHHHSNNHHNLHHHFGNFFNSNFCTSQNQIITTTGINSIERNVSTTTTSNVPSLGNNNLNSDITSQITTGSIDCENNSSNINNNCNITAADSSIMNTNGNTNDNNNINNGNRGWRWPRMPWHRNFDFNLFQQALLSRPGSFNPGLDFSNWPGFLNTANPTVHQYPSTNYINGYPIGIWGPPPPPYSDPNSPNWRIGNSCNTDSNDNQCNETSNNLAEVTNFDNENIFSSQLDGYIDLQPPEYSSESLSIVLPSMNHTESNNNINNTIENEISRVRK